jgi:mannose-6-phosphate isomerase
VAKSNLRIDMLGTSFSISTDEDAAYLESLLNRYRIKVQNTQKKTGVGDPLQLSIVTGIILCDEIEQIQKRRGGPVSSPDDLDEAERLTLDLITRINQVLENGAVKGKTGRIFKLENPVKHYPWGSPRLLSEFLGKPNESGESWAELWMGARGESPSVVIDSEAGGLRRSLGELIKKDPRRYLGEKVNAEFGELPFLFKLLAADKPLSIQVHPGLEQAKAGWERENAAGIPLDGPARNYKDPNHKPEILSALTPFRALCGFRNIPETIKLLDLFGGKGWKDRGDKPAVHLSAALKSEFARLRACLEAGNGLSDFFSALLEMDNEARRDLGVYTLAQCPQLEQDYPEYFEEWLTAASFARLYPEDPAIIAPLYLNLLKLEKGEAIYLPPGTLHAYIEGFGVELMANSDNVLRGGLTAKHMDKEELKRILSFTPYHPGILRPAGVPPGEGWLFYPTGVREFTLGTASSQGEGIPLPEGKPAIVLVTEGEAVISAGGEAEITLRRGESAFAAPAEREELMLRGNFRVYAAFPGSVQP